MFFGLLNNIPICTIVSSTAILPGYFPITREMPAAFANLTAHPGRKCMNVQGRLSLFNTGKGRQPVYPCIIPGRQSLRNLSHSFSNPVPVWANPACKRAAFTHGGWPSPGESYTPTAGKIRAESSAAYGAVFPVWFQLKTSMECTDWRGKGAAR